MNKISCFFKYIISVFSPSYIYTLDKSCLHEDKDEWVFKEFGTHTYIIKTWEQLQEGNFFREINPRDLSYIAKVEARKSIGYCSLRICEEKKGGIFILNGGFENISVTGNEFLKDHDLVRKTEHNDIIRIAYLTGLKKGREISKEISNKSISPEPTGKSNLKLVK